MHGVGSRVKGDAMKTKSMLLCLLMIALLGLLAAPALAADVAINAVSPGGYLAAPLHQGSSYTFTYVVGDEKGLIPAAGVPATVYITHPRTHKVESQFNTWMYPGTGFLPLSPQWKCTLRAGHYLWTLWPTFPPEPVVSFYSICQGFDVVK